MKLPSALPKANRYGCRQNRNRSMAVRQLRPSARLLIPARKHRARKRYRRNASSRLFRDWRNTYFVPDNLNESVDRADALKELLRKWNQEHSSRITMPELALRFILNNPTVSTMIPGMRKLSHVESNIAAGDAGPLPDELYQQLKQHRWVRKPTPWSQ
ncbi:MAG: hypothetical protein DMF73_19950 [Acidobacteria bacterium]|nr:MAG: hypothetical protein DMF73_19950 [Acidobacteriota bacterium]